MMTKNRRLVLVLALIISALGIVLALWAFRGRNTRYHGIVLDAETKFPLEGVSIAGRYCINKRFAPTLDGLWSKDWLHVYAVTDLQGRFVIDMPGNDHLLTFTKKGYAMGLMSMFRIQVGKDEIVVYLRKGNGMTDFTPP